MANMTQPGFWSRFKKAVPNFDETKCWLEKKSGKLYICFIEDGKLKRCEVYKAQYYIDLWKQHFIDYFKTGMFDFNGYYIVYDKDAIDPSDINRVWQFPLVNKYGNDCYEYSDEMSKFLSSYRKKWSACGMKTVGKPANWTGNGIYNIDASKF